MNHDSVSATIVLPVMEKVYPSDDHISTSDGQTRGYEFSPFRPMMALRSLEISHVQINYRRLSSFGKASVHFGTLVVPVACYSTLTLR